MVKYKVGDKVRITGPISFSYFVIGDTTEVTRIDEWDGTPYLKNKSGNGDVCTTLLESKSCIELVSSEAQRITTLEKANADMLNEIKALTSRITALEKRPVAITELAKVASAAIIERKRQQTPNQRRKAAIERAKAFVEDIEYLADSSFGNPQRGVRKRTTLKNFETDITKPEYHVNKEKRVVTVLVKGRSIPTLYGKAIARCSPDDVFNVHIGKAIALAKAYGLEVPREFTHAPQPDKPAIGQITTFKRGHDYHEKVLYSVDDLHSEYDNLTIIKDASSTRRDATGHKAGADLSNGFKNLIIFDDSEAQYDE